MQKETYIALAIGMLVYFLLEFRAKGFKWKEVNPLFWLRDNGWNLLTTAIVCFAWVYVADGMSKLAAFSIGLGWNNIWDRLEDITFKKKIS